MSAKQRAIEIFNQHIELAKAGDRGFRKTVMDQLMSETGCSLASAATHYNNAKKQAAPVEGLGRPAVTKGARLITKGKASVEIQDDADCYTVLELVDDNVARSRSHLLQGDASESFDSKIVAWPNTVWVMVQGLGPNPGETFKLAEGEKEIKRFTPEKIIKPRPSTYIDDEEADID